jgi:hypothetical protein
VYKYYENPALQGFVGKQTINMTEPKLAGKIERLIGGVVEQADTEYFRDQVKLLQVRFGNTQKDISKKDAEAVFKEMDRHC